MNRTGVGRFTISIDCIPQPPTQTHGSDGVMRTPMDLELELQASRTRHSRLNEELRVLRQLKEQMESARQQGQRSLPAWVQEDERFRLLLTQAEKQVCHVYTSSRITCSTKGLL